MNLYNENKFLIIGLPIITAIYLLDYGSIYEGTYIPTYTAHGTVYSPIDSTKKQFEIISYEAEDTIIVVLDDIGKALFLNNNGKIIVGENIWFDVNYSDWKDLNLKSRHKEFYKVYSITLLEKTIFSTSQYIDIVMEQNKNQYLLNYFRLLVIFLIVDLLRRNKENIVEKMDWVGEKIDKAIDPIAKYPNEVQNYIHELYDIGYSGRIRLTKNDSKFDSLISEDKYKLKTQSLWPFMLIYLGLVITSFFFEQNIRYIFFIILITLINSLLFLLNSTKNKVVLTLSNEGISERDNAFIEWSTIQYAFIYKAQNRHGIILKHYNKNIPSYINILDVSMSSRKIGHLIEQFRRKYKA